jgi:predicted alpha/beta hydrolase family esterase
VAFWAAKFHRDIRGAFLVGPSDVEAPTYPPGTTGFNPMPQGRIPFPTRVIASTDDFFVRIERARQFAQNWGSELIEVGPVGHINVASGHGPWPEGLRLLSEFEKNLPS